MIELIYIVLDDDYCVMAPRDRKVYQIAAPFIKGCISVASIEFDGMFVARIDSQESMPKVSEFKWRDTEAEAEAASTEAQERCTMPPAQSAERHVRFPSNPMAPGRFIAAIATRSISPQGRPEDTKPKSRFMRFSHFRDSDSNSSWIVGAGRIISPAGLYFSFACISVPAYFIYPHLSVLSAHYPHCSTLSLPRIWS
jgi:hypothetical protein